MTEMGNPYPRSTFGKARRKKVVRKLVRTLKQEDTGELLPLGEVTKRLRLFEQSYVGLRPIPLDRIVGTMDPTADYDRDFLPRRRGMEDRWRRVEEMGRVSFPPIEVYQLDDAYFVVDGHHRVAIAKQLGMAFLDAEVTRLRTRFPLPADANIAHVILHEQEGRFREESGLAVADPSARIPLTRANGYVELLELVKVHGYHLMLERGQVLGAEEVAADWYQRVYRPAVGAIHEGGLAELFPRAQDGDLFIWVSQRRRDLVPEHGTRSFEDDVVALRDAELLHRRKAPRRALGRLKRPRRES